MNHVLLLQLPIPRRNFGRKTGNIPLGAACLKQATRGLPGVRVDLLPERTASCLGDAALLNLLSGHAPDVFGFTVFSWNLERSLYLSEKLKAAGQPITSWTPLVSDGRYYIPSNDFSIMVSKAMYDDVFLPGIRRECQFLDHSIYHLDGPGALRHLDSLLAIPELDALQWVFGAGNEGFSRWV